MKFGSEVVLLAAATARVRRGRAEETYFGAEGPARGYEGGVAGGPGPQWCARVGWASAGAAARRCYR